MQTTQFAPGLGVIYARLLLLLLWGNWVCFELWCNFDSKIYKKKLDRATSCLLKNICRVWNRKQYFFYLVKSKCEHFNNETKHFKIYSIIFYLNNWDLRLIYRLTFYRSHQKSVCAVGTDRFLVTLTYT